MDDTLLEDLSLQIFASWAGQLVSQ